MRDNHSLPCYQTQQQPSSTKGGCCYSVSLHCGESWSGWSDVLMLPRIHHLAEGDFPANLYYRLLTRWVGHRWCCLYPPRLLLSFFTGKHFWKAGTIPRLVGGTAWKMSPSESELQAAHLCSPTSCRSLRSSGSSPLAAHAGAGAGADADATWGRYRCSRTTLKNSLWKSITISW